MELLIMHFSYPNQKWWDESTKYANSFDHFITCQKCLWSDEGSTSEEPEPICDFCNEEIHSFTSVVNVSLIFKNLDKFSQFDDYEFDATILDLSKLTYDCPECCSIDDEQYYCTSCEGLKVSEADRLVKLIVETNDNIHIAERIQNKINRI